MQPGAGAHQVHVVADEGVAVVQLDRQHQAVAVDVAPGQLLVGDAPQGVAPEHRARLPGAVARRHGQGLVARRAAGLGRGQQQGARVRRQRCRAGHLQPRLAAPGARAQPGVRDPGRTRQAQALVGRLGGDLQPRARRLQAAVGQQAHGQRHRAVVGEAHLRAVDLERRRCGRGQRRQQAREAAAHAPAAVRHRSAICTLLVAAPLRRLSLTTHRLRPRGWSGSLRTRPTNTASEPSASSAAVG